VCGGQLDGEQVVAISEARFEANRGALAAVEGERDAVDWLALADGREARFEGLGRAGELGGEAHDDGLLPGSGAIEIRRAEGEAHGECDERTEASLTRAHRERSDVLRAWRTRCSGGARRDGGARRGSRARGSGF